MSQVLDLLMNLKIGIGGAIGLGEVCEGIVEVILSDLFFKVREDKVRNTRDGAEVGRKLRTDFGSAILEDNLN
jgi:hypothetical protein